MESLFVLSTVTDILIGVHTSHRKAVQAMLMETIPFNYKMTDYTYELGIEFYTFTNDKNTELTYKIQEVIPDQRV